MNINIKELEKSTIELTVEVSAAEVASFEDQAVNRIKDKVEVKGFRKGQAPKNKVIAQVGKEAINEEIQDLAINATYPKALDEKQIDVVSRPMLTEVKWNEDESFTYVVTVAVKPTITLGDYKAKVETMPEITVSTEEVDAEIEKELAQFSKHVAVERAAALNDLVIIDFEGFLGDEAFEGGKGESHPLELGSNSFIPGFEEQLVGSTTGTNVDVNVTFPEEYHSDALAGKEATFKVTIHEIKEKVLPMLDDSFIADLERSENTVEEFKAAIEAKLLADKTSETKNELTTKVIDALVEEAGIVLSELQIQSEVERKMQEMNQQLQQQGLDLETYFQLTGQDAKAMQEQLTPEITNQISRSLIVEAIVNAENFEVSAEEVEAEFAEMAANYGMSVEDIKNALGGDTEMMKVELQYKKAVDSLTK